MRLDEFQDRLRALDWYQFEKFIFDLLRETGRFAEVRTSVVDAYSQYDIVATENDSLTGSPSTWYFEVKHWKRPIGISVVQDVAIRYTHLRDHRGTARFVLVTSGVLTRGALASATSLGIEVWDSTRLAHITPAKVVEEYLGESLDLPQEELPKQIKAESLLRLLDSLPAGKKAALDYQRAVADILEFLFCPPLEPPEYEVSDTAKRNRRDIILENYAPEGLWAHLRSQYSAEYIVVDAKNYSGLLKKQSVVDVAHYLKPYGCGMFAIISSRKGAGPSAEHAIREQWIGASKMIVVLDDADIKEMIRIRADGGLPESVIRAKIADFRMKL